MDILTALGLGLITVIHPCPLSTNISAATLLLGLQHKSHQKIALAVVFVLGEALTFASIGILLAFGGLKVAVIVNILQSIMHQLIGPVLILIGMMLAGILLKNQSTLKIADRFTRRSTKFGIGGGFVLGILVALSFCPMSAALFFGVLVPLAVSNREIILLPVLFSIGSSVPLLVITGLVATSTRNFKQTISNVHKRKYGSGLGIVLIIFGIYLSLHRIFALF